MQTPWGPSQQVTECAPGVLFVSTASHGGFRITPEAEGWHDARQIAQNSNYSFLRSDGSGNPVAWLEEDCDAPRFARAHGIN